MTTPLDIISQALKAIGAIGVGQTPLAEDSNDALFQLNMMISQWNQKRWLIYHLVDTSIVSTGRYYYTVGEGLDFDIARPAKIDSGFMRWIASSDDFSPDDFSIDFANAAGSQVDYPLKIILAREDYNRIWSKRLTGPAGYLFYDSGYPEGRLYLWPNPPADLWSIHISTKAVISQFTSISQTIVLPPEYMAALYYNLSIRLAPMYQVDPREDVFLLAKDALDTIRGANVQIPTLVMPDGVISGWNQYNIINDTM